MKTEIVFYLPVYCVIDLAALCIYIGVFNNADSHGTRCVGWDDVKDGSRVAYSWYDSRGRSSNFSFLETEGAASGAGGKAAGPWSWPLMYI